MADLDDRDPIVVLAKQFLDLCDHQQPSVVCAALASALGGALLAAQSSGALNSPHLNTLHDILHGIVEGALTARRDRRQRES